MNGKAVNTPGDVDDALAARASDDRDVVLARVRSSDTTRVIAISRG
jgi:hypothetical protein